jgi:hypothetical protein
MAQFLAGEIITADKLSTLVGTKSLRTVGSGTFTTSETILDTVTVDVVAGRSYKIIWDTQLQSSVADGYARARIRETNVSGTVVQLRNHPTNLTASQSFPIRMEASWTATSTGSMTFVATAVRMTGTGNLSSFASSDNVTAFYVENDYGP